MSHVGKLYLRVYIFRVGYFLKFCEIVEKSFDIAFAIRNCKIFFIMTNSETEGMVDFDYGEAEALIKYTVPVTDLEHYQNAFRLEVESGTVNPDTKFHYALCLVHSQRNTARQAIPLLHELFEEGDEKMKRDCLFYLVVIHAKLKEYLQAKKYVKSFLSVEPTNVQMQQLEKYVNEKLKKDGLAGMAIVGGAAVLGGIAALVIGGIVLATGAGVAAVRAIKGKPKGSKPDKKEEESDKNEVESDKKEEEPST